MEISDPFVIVALVVGRCSRIRFGTTTLSSCARLVILRCGGLLWGRAVPTPELRFWHAREIAVAILLAFIGSTGTSSVRGAERDVVSELETVREKYKLPALGVAVVLSNQVAALEVVGVRKFGVREPATRNDKWHHGSLTKSMTATLAGILVDEGKLRWTTTIEEVFPELAKSMHKDWRSVTVEQLLSHRAGAPGDLTKHSLWGRLWNHPGTPVEQRTLLLTEITAEPPESKPGTKHQYANAGYAIVGAMLEKITGTAWEDLITAKLFDRLGMKSAGFGAPAAPRYINQPWGHTMKAGTPVPIEPGTSADNPPAIGPGGTVHCTLEDMAKYVAFHLAGARGEGTLLKQETFEKLYADIASQGYGLGWGVTDRSWAGGKALHHTGTNTQWYTNVWIAPNKRFAVIIVTNIGGDDAFKATDAVAAKIIQMYL